MWAWLRTWIRKSSPSSRWYAVTLQWNVNCISKLASQFSIADTVFLYSENINCAIWTLFQKLIPSPISSQYNLTISSSFRGWRLAIFSWVQWRSVLNPCELLANWSVTCSFSTCLVPLKHLSCCTAFLLICQKLMRMSKVAVNRSCFLTRGRLF